MYLYGHDMRIFSENNYRATTCGHHFTGRWSLIAHFNKYIYRMYHSAGIRSWQPLCVLIEGDMIFFKICLFKVILRNECIHKIINMSLKGFKGGTWVKSQGCRYLKEGDEGMGVMSSSTFDYNFLYFPFFKDASYRVWVNLFQWF